MPVQLVNHGYGVLGLSTVVLSPKPASPATPKGRSLLSQVEAIFNRDSGYYKHGLAMAEKFGPHALKDGDFPAQEPGEHQDKEMNDGDDDEDSGEYVEFEDDEEDEVEMANEPQELGRILRMCRGDATESLLKKKKVTITCTTEKDKMPIAVTVIRALIEDGIQAPILLVIPRNRISAWCQELTKYLDATSVFTYQPKAQDRMISQELEPYKVVVTTPERVRSEWKAFMPVSKAWKALAAGTLRTALPPRGWYPLMVLGVSVMFVDEEGKGGQDTSQMAMAVRQVHTNKMVVFSGALGPIGEEATGEVQEE